MQTFVEDNGLEGFDHIGAGGSQIWRAFGVTAQPSFVFIDDNGELRRHTGYLDTEALRSAINSLR